MTTPSNAATSSTDLSITLTRVFDAPRHLVFEAWTQKKHLDKWCAPRGFTIPESSGDFRVGGTFHTLMLTPSGERYPLRGVYREIIEDKLLVFTHIWEEDAGTPEHETLVTVRFADEGKKTKVTLEQTNFKSVESRDGHRGGWTECLDILSEHLAKVQSK